MDCNEIDFRPTKLYWLLQRNKIAGIYVYVHIIWTIIIISLRQWIFLFNDIIYIYTYIYT